MSRPDRFTLALGQIVVAQGINSKRQKHAEDMRLWRRRKKAATAAPTKKEIPSCT